ncbi:hypothetical protein DFQ28_009204 [Apophysomyces sp. BC1034]|nr:hypothetical protein DFQ30_000923 [Apophysomyces sp. BC1015]KAG0180261.1 hypothetical protein DFQ29_000995 [Apophysomyces sp. BC1021]KAG0185515.1 hypothetical protein DFQ28_009204 [Apophysomyces sp. BC1034]
MYSPTQPEFNLESADQFSPPGMPSVGTPHTTVGAVPVGRNNRVYPSNSYQIHQRHNSFGAASIAMSPPSAAAAAAAAGRTIPFADPNAQNWFGTSLDSTGSSFGQSPIFGGRDIIVSPSTSTGHLDGYAGTEDDELQHRNLQEMFEKRRRRRESHNAVERRRRDNINERIQELSTLLPEHMLETAPTSSNAMSIAGNQNVPNGKAVNKGTILKLSVDHIKELREEVVRYKDRIKELEQLIEAAKRGDYACSPHKEQAAKPPAGGYPSTEQAYLAQQRGADEMYSSSNQPVRLMESSSRSRHERIGSLQFQQQFGNLHIGENSNQP